MYKNKTKPKHVSLAILSIFLLFGCLFSSPASLQNDGAVQIYSSDEKSGRASPAIDIHAIQKAIDEKGALWTANAKVVPKNPEKLLGIKITEKELLELGERETIRGKTAMELPKMYDWRNMHGGMDYMSPVKDQGACGSCWAFAAAGLLEGEANTAYNRPDMDINLSEQQLISCYNSDGCNGLYLDEIPDMLNYISRDSLVHEAYFPYYACDAQGYGSCTSGGIACNGIGPDRADSWGFEAYKAIPLGDVNAIKEAVVSNGPVYASMVVYYDFFSYDGGIYSHVDGGIAGGHAVLITGFGEYDGVEYWIVKNSWGPEWGEDGYFKIEVGDESSLETMSLYKINGPKKADYLPALCTDNDLDGYCYWGTGSLNFEECSKTCKSKIKDCDDSDPSVFEKCGMNVPPTGSLSASSVPSGARLSVRDAPSGNWVKRGTTPVQFTLNAGQREIMLEKFGYEPFISNVTININETTYLEAAMEMDGIFSGDSWFVEFNPQYPSFFTTANTVVADDLNGDGKMEIIMAVGPETSDFPYSESLYVFDHDGNVLNGWPIALPEYAFTEIAPATADMDNDGQKEIIISSKPGYISQYFGKSILAVYNADGTALGGWPVYIDAMDVGTIAVKDVDMDGSLEIVTAGGGQSCSACADHGTLYVFASNGAVETGWPITLETENFFKSSLAILPDSEGNGFNIGATKFNNIDPNGGQNAVYLFNYNGSVKDGFPYALPDQAWGWTLAAGDINLDGNTEVITQKGPITSQGEPMWVLPQNEWMYSLALANIDEDPEIEVVYGSTNGELKAVDSDGSLEFSISKPYIGYFADNSPIVADVLGGNETEIIVPWWINPDMPLPGLYVYSNAGALASGYPLFHNEIYLNDAAAYDLDSDGNNEVVFVAQDNVQRTYLAVLHLKQGASGASEWPKQGFDSGNTYCYDANLSSKVPSGALPMQKRPR